MNGTFASSSRPSRLVPSLTVAALLPFALVTLAACGEDEPAGTARTAYGAVRSCPQTQGKTTCASSQLDDFEGCAAERCNAEYKECLGSGFGQGEFSDTCGDWFTCVARCACGDAACETACGDAPGSCADCLSRATTCARSKCVAPQCAAGVATKRTCADLTACCLRIQEPTKLADCNQEHSRAEGDDAKCSVSFDKYVGDCNNRSN